jgi:hypothetical protein
MVECIHMKNYFLAAAGAAALMCGMVPASAGNVTYTFGITGGGAYCDGLKLSETTTTAIGTHIGGKDCPEGSYAGGFSGKKVLGTTAAQWVITTLEPESPNYEVIFVIDQTAMTWQDYIEDTTDGITLEEVSSGPLLKGTPDHNGTAFPRFGEQARPATSAPAR